MSMAESPHPRGAVFSGRNLVWSTALLAALTLLVLLRVAGLSSQGMTADEYGTSIFSADASLSEYLPINNYRAPDNLPLYFTVLYVWEQVTAMPARWLSVLLSLGSACLLYGLGVRMHSPAAGLLAVICFALSPFNIFHGQAIRPYALYGPLAIASIVITERLISGKRSWQLLACSAAVNLALVYTHLIGAVLLFLEGLALLWLWRREMKSILWWALPQLLGLLPILFILQVPESDPTYPAMTPWRVLLNTFHVDSPIYSVELITSRENWAFTVIGYGWYERASQMATLLSIMLCGYAAWVGLRQRSAGLSFLVFLLLGTGAALYVASLITEPISLPRYMMYVSSVRYVLVGVGIVLLPFLWLRYCAGGVLVALLVVQLCGVFPFGARPEIPRMGEIIREESEPGDFVVTAMYPDALYVHFPIAGDLDLVARDLMAYDLHVEMPVYGEHSAKGVVARVVHELSSADMQGRSAWVVIMRMFDSAPLTGLEGELERSGLTFDHWQYYGYNGFSLYRVHRGDDALVPPDPLPAYDTKALLAKWGVETPAGQTVEQVAADLALLLDGPPEVLTTASNYTALTLLCADRNAALAEAVARAGLARFPEDGSLLLALGVALLLQQNLAGAEEAFRKCLPRLSRGAAPAFGPVLEAAIASDYAKAAATFSRMQVLSGNLFYGVIGRALEQAASAAP